MPYATHEKFLKDDCEIEVKQKQEFNLCKMHKVGKDATGLSISNQIFMNALDGEPKTFREVASIYGVVSPESPREYMFISDLVKSLNEVGSQPMVKVIKLEGCPKRLKMSAYGRNVYRELNASSGQLPQAGYLQLLLFDVAKRNGLPMNTIALVDAVSAGVTFNDLAVCFGVNSNYARDYTFIHQLVNFANNKKVKDIFNMENLTEDIILLKRLNVKFRSNNRWVTLSDYGQSIYQEIQAIKRQFNAC
ncbi:hypothetical protein AB6D11_06270 [Vibrio splendidus]